FDEIPGTERVMPCEPALLAIGFLGADKGLLLSDLGVELDARGNIETGTYMSTRAGVFAASDVQRGQSLVVWAISEGREAARAIVQWLVGFSHLESKDESFTRLPENVA